MLLIECMVYIVVFAILLGVGTAAFYVLWDDSAALRNTADDVTVALRAGEAWRADIRNASGKIRTQTSSDGVLLEIPQRGSDIFYRLSGDTLWRKTQPANSWTPVLRRIKTSQMEIENRDGIKAWCWELQLMPRHVRAKMPLLFSFEAVAPHQS